MIYYYLIFLENRTKQVFIFKDIKYQTDFLLDLKISNIGMFKTKLPIGEWLYTPLSSFIKDYV